MENIDQTKEITLIRKKILTPAKNGTYERKNFTFITWIICHFKSIVHSRYHTSLLCQTEIDQEDTLYHLDP